jgi:hypothetical protein
MGESLPAEEPTDVLLQAVQVLLVFGTKRIA